MKDSDVRGIILRRLYEIRHQNHGMINIPDGLGIIDIPEAVLGNCAGQLAEQNLIKLHPRIGRPYKNGWAAITAHGVDVVEETTRSAIAITFDQSVRVHGSSNVQIGQGNNQTVSGDSSVQAGADGAVINQPSQSSLIDNIKTIAGPILKWCGIGS